MFIKLRYFDTVAKFYQKLPIFFPRKKLETEVILSSIRFSKNEIVLDVGCGPGIYLKKIENLVKTCIGIDTSKNMIKTAKSLCRKSFFILGNVNCFNFKKKFDKILCLGILEFCKNPENVLKNISEHLKRGGKLILLYPKNNSPGYFYKIFHWIFSRKRIHLFRKKWIDNIAENFNFRKIRQIEFFLTVMVIYEKI